MLTGQRPRLLNAKVFGCDAYTYIRPDQRNKFDPKAKKGIFVGLSTSSRAYLVLDPRTGIVTSSRDVVFDEKVLDLSDQLAKREARRQELEAKQAATAKDPSSSEGEDSSSS